jgi:hypothetical protein
MDLARNIWKEFMNCAGCVEGREDGQQTHGAFNTIDAVRATEFWLYFPNQRLTDGTRTVPGLLPRIGAEQYQKEGAKFLQRYLNRRKPGS